MALKLGIELNFLSYIMYCYLYLKIAYNYIMLDI